MMRPPATRFFEKLSKVETKADPGDLCTTGHYAKSHLEITRALLARLEGED